MDGEMRHRAKLLRIKGLIGGRSRARTADLLLVRPVAGFFWLSDVYPVLWNFNNLGNLLFARQTTQMARIDGVLIRF
jgi:hypothetical protein